MICKIVQVFPLQVREYTDRDNRPQVFKSKGFLLDDGRHTIYAEAIQEWAQFHEDNKVKANDTVICHPVCRARSYKDNQGNERYSNEITIQAIKKA